MDKEYEKWNNSQDDLLIKQNKIMNIENKPIKEKPFNGKTIEQYWTDLISKNLVGRTITKIEYVSQEECEEAMWYSRPVAIQLDNKYWIIPTSDDEGNNGGAISTTFKELGTIPVI